MAILHEDKRSSLMSQGRRGAKEKGTGKSRYEMRVNSKVATTTREFNNLDMQSLFVHNILTINIPVVGETDNYLVRIKFGGFLDLVREQLERQHVETVDLRIITRALLDAFNREDVYISCTCLHPDTKIKLLDGTSPTVEEMYKRFVDGEKLYCYSVDSKGDFVPGEVEKVWITGEASEFIEVTLDNDEVIRTTPDHLYMLRDGSYVQASDLCVGQSLMPLYFGSTNGYETIRYNSHRGCNSTYKMVASYFKEYEIIDAENRASPDDNMPYKVAIHHSDFNKSNNTPENLQIMTAKEHWMYHASLSSAHVLTESGRKKLSECAKRRNGNPTPAMIEQRKAFNEAGILRNYDPDRKQQQAELMRVTMREYYANLSDEERIALSASIGERSKEAWKRGCFDTPAFKEASTKKGEFLHTPEIEELAKIGHKEWWDNLTDEEKEPYREIFRENGKKASSVTKGVPKSEETRKKMSDARLNEDPEKRNQRVLRCAYTKIETVLREMLQNGLPMTEEQYLKTMRSGYPNVLKYFSSIDEAVEYFRLNHKIKSIRMITVDTPTPVYDIKMVGEPNFLVNAGVVLHNCKDFHYRFGFWCTMKDVNSGVPERRPSKITNPRNDLGPGCKHIMLVLSNNSWLIKVARVINNWIIYMSKNRQKQYADIVYPAIYGKPYEEPVQLSIDDETDVNNQSDIDTAIEQGRTRGQFKTGNEYRFRPSTTNKGQLSMDNIDADENTN